MLSHQFPVDVVVAATVVVTVVEVVDVGIITEVVFDAVIAVDVAGCEVAVDVAVVEDELQDVKSSDATRRTVSDNKIIPLFILAS